MTQLLKSCCAPLAMFHWLPRDGSDSPGRQQQEGMRSWGWGALGTKAFLENGYNMGRDCKGGSFLVSSVLCELARVPSSS